MEQHRNHPHPHLDCIATTSSSSSSSSSSSTTRRYRSHEDSDDTSALQLTPPLSKRMASVCFTTSGSSIDTDVNEQRRVLQQIHEDRERRELELAIQLSEQEQQMKVQASATVTPTASNLELIENNNLEDTEQDNSQRKGQEEQEQQQTGYIVATNNDPIDATCYWVDTAAIATTETTAGSISSNGIDDDDFSTTTALDISTTQEAAATEYQRWLSKIKNDWSTLKDAPYHIQNNKQIVCLAIRQNHRAFQYATQKLRNDKDVRAAVEYSINTRAKVSKAVAADYQYWLSKVKNERCGLLNVPYRIRNNKNIVIAAVERDVSNFGYATPELQNDKAFVMAAILQDPQAFWLASTELRDDPDVEYRYWLSKAIKHESDILYAPSDLRDELALHLVEMYGLPAFEKLPSKFQKDKKLALAVVQHSVKDFQSLPQEFKRDKDVVLLYLENHPDHIKLIHEDLKRDPDVLVAAGMFDEGHDDAKRRQQVGTDILQRKIVFSTRFALNQTSFSHATNFTSLFKKSKYIKEEGNNFIVYAPNAFDKKTCDPNWTDYDWPCRGTKETCQYKNILTDDGYPTDACCWRYSFRNQLEEAKNTQGFMLQLVETAIREGKVDNVTLGKGQEIELDMANDLKLKVFQVYRPTFGKHESWFTSLHIDEVTNEISQWYDDDCEDMSVKVIRPCTIFWRH